MLYILFGSTAEMGQRCRDYFRDHGLPRIEKLNYVPRKAGLTTLFGSRTKATKKQVEACDYIYENGGVKVGFNKAQILDAVSGRCNCLLTLSTSTFDFIRDIKAAYGDYVTVIGTYIDPLQLEKMYKANRSVSRKERSLRMEIGESIKRILLENRALFDEIILYGGEDSAFDLDSLDSQLELIVHKAEQRQRRMNDVTYVDLPYKGPKPYVFICYAHDDRNRVLPVLRLLQLVRCRVWYDDGIKGGDNWRVTLSDKIRNPNCKGVVLFSSQKAVSSHFVSEEVDIALECNRRIITVRLDDAIFNYKTETHLQTYQNLFYTDQRFDEKLIEAVGDDVKIGF